MIPPPERLGFMEVVSLEGQNLSIYLGQVFFFLIKGVQSLIMSDSNVMFYIAHSLDDISTEPAVRQMPE